MVTVQASCWQTIMRRRWKILAGLVVLTVAGAWLLPQAASPALRDLDKTRRALRRDGFKLDLREFNLALSPELSSARRAACEDYSGRDN